MHGFQLWVNLPRRDKLMTPRYQEIPAGRIPLAAGPGGVTVRVIAGEALGARAVIDTRTPIAYLHYTLRPGAETVQPVPAAWTAAAYVFGGEGRFGGTATAAHDGQLVVFAGDGEAVRLAAAGERPLEVLLLAGVPLREPVARYGPFVMNTPGEIRQAMLDYQSGRFGQISA
jgi:redox-sensitive bicupin YhaK (pirin superfamily)